MMFNQSKKMVPFVTRKLALVSMSESWFLGVNIFDLDFGIQVDSVKQPI